MKCEIMLLLKAHENLVCFCCFFAVYIGYTTCNNNIAAGINLSVKYTNRYIFGVTVVIIITYLSVK